MTTVFVINRTPSPILNNTSPYEKVHQTIPNYNEFRVFGCLTYASTLKHNKFKFDKRARLCVFIGYPMGTKGYKLYDIQFQRMCISRDVVFREDTFPFLDINRYSQHEPQRTNQPVPLTRNLNLELPSETISANPEGDITYEESEGQLEEEVQQVRRSSRVSRQPRYLEDYHCNLLNNSPTTSTNCLYYISKCLHYELMSDKEGKISMNLSSTMEPTTFQEAVKQPKWKKSIQDELEALKDNNT